MGVHLKDRWRRVTGRAKGRGGFCLFECVWTLICVDAYECVSTLSPLTNPNPNPNPKCVSTLSPLTSMVILIYNSNVVIYLWYD